MPKFEQFTEPATGVKKYGQGDTAAIGITGGTIAGTKIAPATQAITAAAAIDPEVGHVSITGPATSTYAVTLAAPTVPGVVMVIEMVGTTSTNAVTLALTNVVGGSAATTATFNAAGEILTLVSGTAKWIVLDEIGVTLA